MKYKAILSLYIIHQATHTLLGSSFSAPHRGAFSARVWLFGGVCPFGRLIRKVRSGLSAEESLTCERLHGRRAASSVYGFLRNVLGTGLKSVCCNAGDAWRGQARKRRRGRCSRAAATTGAHNRANEALALGL